MKTVKISDETYEFLKDLAYEIKTRDNRSSKQYFLAISYGENKFLDTNPKTCVFYTTMKPDIKKLVYAITEIGGQ